MRTISSFEFARRFHHSVTNHDGRFVWFLGAGCSVSAGIGDASATAERWLRELKYLETGDGEGVTDWIGYRFPAFDGYDYAGLYGSVLRALFYTEQEQERELERINASAEPGFGYATLAQLVTHPRWGERFNTVLTTNFDDLVAEALYIYSQRRPQVLTHESFDRRIRISDTRPTIVKIDGDAHLMGAGRDAHEARLRSDVMDRLRAQMTESAILFVGYGGRDESVRELLEGLPPGAPAGGVYWVNVATPAPALKPWLEERNAVHVNASDFESMMFLIRREFDLGHPRIDRFDQILKRYDEQFKALSEREDLQINTSKRFYDPMPEQGAELPAARMDAQEKMQTIVPALETGRVSFKEPSPESNDVEALEKDTAVAPVLADQTIKDAASADSAWQSNLAKDDLSIPPMPYAAEQSPQVNGTEGCDWGAIPDQFGAQDVVAADEIMTSDQPPSNDLEETSTTHVIAAAVEAMATRQNDPNLLRAQAAIAADDARNIAEIIPQENLAGIEGAGETDIAQSGSASKTVQALPHMLDTLPVPKRVLPRVEAEELNARYAAALNETPNNARLLSRYAQFLAIACRDHDGAEHYFNRSIDTDPTDTETLIAFAGFLTEIRRDLDRAEDCYRLALRADFEDPSALCAYAEFLWTARQDHQAAGECYQVAVDAAPRNAKALTEYARFLHLAGQKHDAAFALLKLAVASSKDDPRPSVHLGQFLATTRGDLAKAEASFEQALTIAPKSPDTLSAAASFYADRVGNTDRAEALFERALEIDPGEPKVLRAYAEFKARYRSDQKGAEELLGKAMAADPGDSLNALAFARFIDRYLDDIEGADEHYRRAVHLDPNNASALAAYARFQHRVRNNPASAEDRYAKALKLNPNHLHALSGYAYLLMTERDAPQEAEPLLRRALRLDPENASVLVNLAKILLQRGAAQEAEEMYQRAVTADPRRIATTRQYAYGLNPGLGVHDAPIGAQRDDAAALSLAAQGMFLKGRPAEGTALLNRAFETVSAAEPEESDSELLLELWFQRYVFQKEGHADSAKAVISLAKSGAMLGRERVNTVMQSEPAKEHPLPQQLQEISEAVVGENALDIPARSFVA